MHKIYIFKYEKETVKMRKMERIKGELDVLSNLHIDSKFL